MQASSGQRLLGKKKKIIVARFKATILGKAILGLHFDVFSEKSTITLQQCANKQNQKEPSGRSEKSEDERRERSLHGCPPGDANVFSGGWGMGGSTGLPRVGNSRVLGPSRLPDAGREGTSLKG